MSNPPVVAVVLAGGTGARIGHELPKQLLQIDGRPMIQRSIAAFERCDAVDEIIVMMAPDYLDAVETLVDDAGFTKVTRVLGGGDTRTASTRKALAALREECLVLFHDAARPFVTDRIIGDCIAALRGRFRAVTTAVDSADTILLVRDGRVAGSLDRSTLARCQTPQGFHRSVIAQAFARADQDPSFSATDDASVVARYLPEEPIGVIRGDARNLKVTDPVDLRIAQVLASEPSA